MSTAGLNTGTLRLFHPLDFRNSLGGPHDAASPLAGAPALVYASDTVQPRPAAEVLSFPADAALGVATTVRARLAFNATTFPPTYPYYDPYPWRTYDPAERAPGRRYLLGQLTQDPVAQTGVYPWVLHTQMAFPDGTLIDQYTTGTAVVVSNDNSPFGAGWTVAGVDQLVITPDAVVRVRGSGEAPQLFTRNPDGSFAPPPEDLGALSRNPDGSFSYTGTDGLTQSFNASGQLVSISTPHGLAAACAYRGAQLRRAPAGRSKNPSLALLVWGGPCPPPCPSRAPAPGGHRWGRLTRHAAGLQKTVSSWTVSPQDQAIIGRAWWMSLTASHPTLLLLS